MPYLLRAGLWIKKEKSPHSGSSGAHLGRYAGRTSLLMGLSLVYFPDLYVHETPADTIEKGGKRKLKFLSLLKVHVYSDFTESSLYCRNFFL